MKLLLNNIPFYFHNTVTVWLELTEVWKVGGTYQNGAMWLEGKGFCDMNLKEK